MRILFALFLTVFGWSSSFIFIRMGLESYSPEVITLGRYLVASLIGAVIYAYIPKKVEYSLKDRLRAAGCGMVGMGIYSYAVGSGEQTVPASIAGFIIGMMPLCSSVLASFIYKEPLSRRLTVGILISLAGLSVIAFSGHNEAAFEKGILWLILAAVCATAYTLIQKPVIKKMPTADFTCHALWGSAFILLLIYLCRPQDLSQQIAQAKLSATLSILYQGVVPSILAYFGWSYALTHTNVAKAAIALYTMPMVTAILAFLILGERPTPIALIGMLLAFGGSLLGTLKLPKKKVTATRVVTMPQEEA